MNSSKMAEKADPVINSFILAIKLQAQRKPYLLKILFHVIKLQI